MKYSSLNKSGNYGKGRGGFLIWFLLWC